MTRTPDQDSYGAGQVVTLTVALNAGYTFRGWSDDVAASRVTTTVTMNSDRTVVANFARRMFDQRTPALTNYSPAQGSIQVRPNILVMRHLRDVDAGVDVAFEIHGRTPRDLGESTTSQPAA